MTVMDATSIEELVGDHDLPLCRLSNEELQALWAAERLEVDPDAAEMIGSAVRSLVAAGHAEVDMDGKLILGEHAALVRNVKSATLTSLVWQHDNDPVRPVRTWSLLGQDLVLEQVYEHPGVHAFTVRRLRSALRCMVADLVPATAGQSDDSAEQPQAPQAIQEIDTLPEGLTQFTQLRVLQVEASETPEAVQFRQTDLALASDGAELCIMLLPTEDDSTLVLDVSRRAVYDHLLGMLVER